MRYMLVFLVACAVIGLWVPARTRTARWILGLTVALIVFFWLYPHRL